jgi:hypothetical protein
VWGIVAAFVGLVPTFLASTAGFIAALAFDGLAWIFYLAGAVVSAPPVLGSSRVFSSGECADCFARA